MAGIAKHATRRASTHRGPSSASVGRSLRWGVAGDPRTSPAAQTARPAMFSRLAHMGTDAHLGAQTRRIRTERNFQNFATRPRRPAAALRRLPLTRVQAVVLVIKPDTPAPDDQRAHRPRTRRRPQLPMKAGVSRRRGRTSLVRPLQASRGRRRRRPHPGESSGAWSVSPGGRVGELSASATRLAVAMERRR
jgi:hypothetical protein